MLISCELVSFGIWKSIVWVRRLTASITKLGSRINLCAHPSEVTSECGKKNKCDTQFEKKTASKPVASFAGAAADSVTNCMSCKSGKHPLYACPKFKTLTHEKMMAVSQTITVIDLDITSSIATHYTVVKGA